MSAQQVFFILMAISIFGLAMGAYYYFYPEYVVNRRIKAHHREMADKDPEFREWLELEWQKQIKKCRRMGMLLVIMQTIWIIFLFSLWQKGLGL